MSTPTHTLTLQGSAGPIEALLDPPPEGTAPQGVAVIAHPHPLQGGTMQNKVVQTLARACAQAGWQAIRFNFRGVGASAGSYDEGRGETGDMLAVIEQVAAPGQPLVLGGFSFGTFVACNAAHTFTQAASPAHPLKHLLLVGTAASRFAIPPVDAALHAHTLVLHGEHDDVIPLADVLAWARPQTLPVTVVPGGGHFFHGQLSLLKRLVLQQLQTPPAAH
ncbi:MAG: alpha/beta fold hydrolase [Brachymonas sp.]|nr:alpha/beta fold hydrolase [Brachymonas sp.]